MRRALRFVGRFLAWCVVWLVAYVAFGVVWHWTTDPPPPAPVDHACVVQPDLCAQPDSGFEDEPGFP